MAIYKDLFSYDRELKQFRIYLIYTSSLSFFFTLPLLKYKYNTVPIITNKIWYYIGGNLIIFNKDHDTIKEG